ncbi:MAG: J domain-containing protein [Myxococcota bacterium]
MAGRRKTRVRSTGLILSDAPERVRLRELQTELDARRDSIADVDLEIETLRSDLADFEVYYNDALAPEHATLRRVEGYLRHLWRWSELLKSDPVDDLGSQAKRVDDKRASELKRAPARPKRARRSTGSAPPETEPNPVPREAKPAPKTELKGAYRALARRFHPDLARTENERLQASKMMVRINTLYRDGDLDRLLSLAEQVKGGEVEDPELTIDEQLELLSERLDWFDAVLENLLEERQELEQSPTCELMRNVDQASAMEVDLIGQIRDELNQRIEASFEEVQKAMLRLETDVTDYNRKRTHLSEAALARRSRTALEKRFDPFADKSLIRAGLAEIATNRVSSAARTLSEEICAWADEKPALLDLALLTYVSELSPFPLEGLESYDDLELRYNALGDNRLGLGECLVELDDVLEFGVKKATEKVAHLGLRFRKDTHREAMLVAIKSLPVRGALQRVLGVIGDDGQCDSCHRKVFFLPLFRLRGLDDLRAKVCPKCGHSQAKYWLPRGEDVQSVLNPSYIDLELLTEWSFQIAHQSIATQLVTVEVESMTVGDLKRRFVEDVLARHEIEVSRSQVELHIEDARVLERTPLRDLESQTFEVRFAADSDWTESDAVELIRHRVRNRFKQ